MTISKDLFLSILSMDAYNRGYGAAGGKRPVKGDAPVETAEVPDNGGGIAAAPEMFIHPITASRVDKEMLDRLKAGRA